MVWWWVHVAAGTLLPPKVKGLNQFRVPITIKRLFPCPVGQKLELDRRRRRKRMRTRTGQS